MDRIKTIESRYLKDNVPDFGPGDTVRVDVRITEGDKSRIQPFQGTVIQRRGSGARETFTVRKVTAGVGVERIFPIHSPNVESIKVIRRGRVRRARLFYLRQRHGKKARIREKRTTKEEQGQ
jgi:large subunit ribosomal protein L19